MTVYEPLIGRKQIGEVEKTATRVCRKNDGMVSRMFNVAPIVLFEKGTLDYHRYVKEVLPVALRHRNNKFGNNWTLKQDNGTSHPYQETQDWRFQHFPSLIDKDTWLANSPYLNPLDYCIWDEFAQAINWNKVTLKNSLVSELKRGVKKIRLDVVRTSCSVWTNRLYRMTQTMEII